jgi:hypothetical protein
MAIIGASEKQLQTWRYRVAARKAAGKPQLALSAKEGGNWLNIAVSGRGDQWR